MRLIIRVARQNMFYRAWCPSLPGCQVVADSRQEAHDKIGAAIEGYLSSLDIALPRELKRQFQQASAQ